MRAAGWLAAREVRVRQGRAAVAVAVVAAAAALVSGIEVLARARERAVAADLDAIGPPIVLRPSGDADGGLDARVEEAVARSLGRDLRRLERRLALPRDGATPAIVGVEVGPPPGGATAGAGLAGRLAEGAEVRVAGRRFRLAGFRPAGADAEDFALQVPLGELREALGGRTPTELRVFLEPGADPALARRRLAGAGTGARVSGIDRGEVAERELEGSLAAHRRALYVFVALVAGIALLVASHLDVAERRAELATLVALGSGQGTLLGLVVARSVLVSTGGSLLGAFLGMALAALLAPEASASAALGAVALVPVAAIAIGAAAALPGALASAARDPVPELQGWFG